METASLDVVSSCIFKDAERGGGKKRTTLRQEIIYCVLIPANGGHGPHHRGDETACKSRHARYSFSSPFELLKREARKVYHRKNHVHLLKHPWPRQNRVSQPSQQGLGTSKLRKGDPPFSECISIKIVNEQFHFFFYSIQYKCPILTWG